MLAQNLNDELAQMSRNTAWRFLELSPADFARDGSDQIVASAESVFSLLFQVRRCVVLMDEMEEFLRARDIDTQKESRLVTTAPSPCCRKR
jgi:hypothetical protein